MAGYAWEPEDWEWRLTWTPSMRAAAAGSMMAGSTAAGGATTGTTEAGPVVTHNRSLPDMAAAGKRLLAALQVPPGSTQQQQQQIMQLLGQMTFRLAELEAPQRGLELLQDDQLLSWYRTAVQKTATAAAAELSQPPVVLVIANGGGGLLALLAAAAGAGEVVVVEKWRWGARASKQLLEANRKAHPDLVDRVRVVPGPLSSCCYDPSAVADSAELHGCSTQQAVQTSKRQGDSSALHAAAAGSTAAVGDAAERFRLHRQADVVVTDLFDSR
jgi:hypothetical protein